MTNEELIKEVTKICNDNGFRFIIQVDDGETIKGAWSTVADTKLEKMKDAIKVLCDNVTETKH